MGLARVSVRFGSRCQRSEDLFTTMWRCVPVVITKRPLSLSRTTTLPDLILLFANSRSDFCSDAFSIRADDEVSSFGFREPLEVKTENLPPPIFEAFAMDVPQCNQCISLQGSLPETALPTIDFGLCECGT